MAEHGEWGQKGATLTADTAEKEFGVSHEFIVKGIRAGKLEYRQVSMWGNPALRLLRSQVEKYVAEELGAERLQSEKKSTELRKIKRQIGSLKRQLAALEVRRAEIEKG
jgi:hypothetical protein